MANNSNTVLICTAALRQDTNNLFRAVPNTAYPGQTYDSSPVNSLPGIFSVPLAPTLNAITPWTTTPTHYLGSTWELPSFDALMASIKNGTLDLSSVNWANYNLTKQRAGAAANALYYRTQDWDPNGSLQTYEVLDQNVTAALTELGLQKIPTQPRPF